MAVPDQVVHQLDRRPLVLDADLVEAVGHQTIDQHRRQPVVGEIAQHALIGIGGRGEHDAVDPALVQRLDHLELVGRIVVRVGQQDHQAVPGAFGLDRADDLAEIVVGDGREGEADRVGGRAGERPGQDVGRVADRADGVLDRAHRRRADLAGPVQHVGHGRDRDARPQRNVGHRRHVSLGSFAPCRLRPGARPDRRRRASSELERVDVLGRDDHGRAEHDLAVGADRVVAEPAGLEGLAFLAGDLALRVGLRGVVGQVAEVLDVPPDVLRPDRP